MLSSKDFLEIAKPLVKKYFPSFEAITVKFDDKDWTLAIIEVSISESNYIAELLAGDKELSDLSDLIEMEAQNYGHYSPITVKRGLAINSWSAAQLNRLALNC
jgi:hypothetical protein